MSNRIKSMTFATKIVKKLSAAGNVLRPSDQITVGIFEA